MCPKPPAGGNIKETQVTQAWKCLMSSPFNCNASKDENSLELEAWGKERQANS